MTGPADGYGLTLFVSGASGLAARAVVDTRRLLDQHLATASRLTVVDIHEDPAAGSRSGILVTPTLVRNTPLPARKVAGDLSDVPRVLAALGLVDAG
ncbi:MAG: circadian clock protein KaiB [Solirubrobacteraceae bacterium]|jgi:circadian clock protein KaiB|nr:circadian clock protein KaiB [Solirubrobacteraceae bacterium]